jgi:hypothetical protein
MEDVLRVVAALQHGQPCQLVRAVGPLDTFLPLVAEGIDVDAAGERLDRAAVALQTAGRQQRRVAIVVARGQEGVDRAVAELPQEVAFQ